MRAGLLLLFAVFLAAPARADETILGLTEPGGLRAAFRLKDGAWQPLPQQPESLGQLYHNVEAFPSSATWTVTRAGKALSKLNTSKPDWSLYASNGLLPLASKTQPPQPTDRKLLPYWGGNTPRPFVAVTRQTVRDADAWKAWSPPGAIITKLTSRFRADVGAAPLQCGATPTKHYPNRLIRRGDAYISTGGTAVVMLELDPSLLRDCDGPPDEAFDNRWFLIDSKDIRLIGRSLDWIDAGDYSGEGRSQLVFHKSGYNLDGYVLVWGGLKNQAEFDWSYH
jgi:hypothetical protein